MSYDTINLQVNKIKLCLLFVARISYWRSYDMGGNFVLLYVSSLPNSYVYADKASTLNEVMIKEALSTCTYIKLTLARQQAHACRLIFRSFWNCVH